MRKHPLVVAVMMMLASVSIASGEDEKSFFHERVLPLLESHCFECHSHAARQMEGGLALDWRSGWELGGSRGPTLVPGMADRSLLIQAVQHSEEGLHMPEEKLSDDEIAILVRWVASGAFDDRVAAPSTAAVDDRDWWSLKPLIRPSIPTMGDDPVGNLIDPFVRERLHRFGATMSPPADRRTLIRRVYLDLIGLPPSMEEVDAFVVDREPQAYERLVDRLLASPRYGERWARHWLDTIHFADSHGYEHDVGRDHAWRFRDYVIRALNEDIAWQSFLREQLAADHFFPNDPDRIPALGFLGAGTFDLSTYSTAPITFEYLDRDDLVTQTMAAFASTTANCARCHSHKFDPIPQEDYYALQAVFAGIAKGDIAFDESADTARDRSMFVGLLEAAEKRDAAILMNDDNVERTEAWLRERGQGSGWVPLAMETFLASDGSELKRTDGGYLLAHGKNPERDTYVITGTTTLSRLTAIRLDVHADPTLPQNGPGRAPNGNLHLSELEVHVFDPRVDHAQRLTITRGTADFDQEGWGVQRSIDGDPQTAWGIHPRVGESHHAVFEFSQPIALHPGTRIAVTLRQSHGGSHLIGALSLSLTDDDPQHSMAIPSEVERLLGKSRTERTIDEQLAIVSFVTRRYALDAIKRLPSMARVYAAGTSVEIPMGNGQTQPKRMPEPRVVHILHRGDFGKPQSVVSPGALTALTHQSNRFESTEQRESVRRAWLADWLAHPENRLTWRSVVNRIWHFHFGRGLCDTPSDFGRMGGVPTHPELIDALAVWFRDDAKGSLKMLHRLIVLSDTYRQSSAEREELIEIDRDNRWLGRQSRQRLDADAIRDSILAVSGGLNEKMGGPAVQHFRQSRGPQSTPVLDYATFDWGGDFGRRSIYRCVWRGIADPFMESIDFPDLGLLAPARGFSVSSLQALSLFNNSFILHHSQLLSERLSVQYSSVDEQVDGCVRSIWLRHPTDHERDKFVAFVRAHGLSSLCRTLFNSNEFLFVE